VIVTDEFITAKAPQTATEILVPFQSVLDKLLPGWTAHVSGDLDLPTLKLRDSGRPGYCVVIKVAAIAWANWPVLDWNRLTTMIEYTVPKIKNARNGETVYIELAH
jgi:hypothetical protein